MYRKIKKMLTIKTMKGLVSFVLLCMIVQMMTMEVKAEDAPSSELTLQATSIPEANLKYREHFRFPFLQGTSALTKNNNIDIAVGGDLSPLSIYGVASAVWTPIAFFKLSAGGRVGSGWSLDLSEKIYGIGINKARSDTDSTATAESNAFDGVLYKAQAGATLQFDFAAIFPGDWNHVVILTYHEINYKGYSKAKKYDSWYELRDDGENVNGYNYYANLLIGYQMPTLFSMIAAMAEADNYVSHRSKHKEWGDEKTRWIFSGILGFTFTEQLGLMVLTQFRTQVNYLEVKDWEDIYYRERALDPDKSRLRVEFYRVVASLNYKF